MMVRAWLAGAAVLVATACDDRQHPGASGSISVQVTSVDGQPFAAPSEEAAQGSAFNALVQDSGKVTVTGPTTKTLLLNRATTFTGTVTDLAVGTYTVNVYTYLGGVVSYYGTVTNVTVSAGNTTAATISNFASFAPAITGTFITPTDAFRINVPFTGVGANATAYKIETASNVGFTANLTSVQVAASPGTATVNGLGQWYVRVSAVNPVGAPSGGVPSPNGTFVVQIDRRTSADDPITAPNLGFFATSTVTLDSLNVFPVADADWFSVSQCNGDSLTVSALALRLSPASPLNSALQLYNSGGLLIAQNDDSGGTNTDGFVRVAHTADNAYKIRVSGSQNSVGHYRVQIQPKAGANNLTSSCRVVPMPTTVVSSGLYHSCSVRSGNIVDCWGNNADGQLGNNTTTTTASPTRVSGATTFGTVSAGGFHTCAISGSAAFCWGSNFFGQLGDATTTNRLVPTAVAGGHAFSSISAGDRHTCAVNGSPGPIRCWGLNNTGQLGNGGSSNTSSPTLISGGLSFQSVGAGSQHTCGITNTSQIYCWGVNTDGQIGDGTVLQRNSPTLIPPPATFTWASVSVGGFHTCGLTTTGVAFCWGRNDFGGLGNGGLIDSPAPTAVAGGLTFSALALGRNFSCGFSGSGTFCWGSNFDGQLGDNSTTDRTGPTLVSNVTTFQQLAPGGFHTCAAQTTTGNAYCWGWNHFGQTGDGLAMNHTGPTPVTGIALALKAISVGNLHTCGATTGNAPYCWGWNLYGQVGDATFADRIQPQLVAGGLSVQTVVSGAYHSCALSTANFVFCWGDNSIGQFGNGGFASGNTPVAGGGGQTFTQISAGDNHTCGRSSTGAVVCWGQNSTGQLGNNSTTTTPSPVTVAGTNYTSVSAGSTHTCAVNSSNQAFCWGENFAGGVGDNSTTQRLAPTAVSGGLSFASISAGYNFTCGRTTANAAYCWGLGGSGQIGNNATNSFSTPQLVSGGLTWTSVSTNRNQTACGLASTGVAYCWGDNFNGGIGDRTFVNRSTPTPVFTSLAFTSIGVGDLTTCAYVANGTPYCWGGNERGSLGNNTRTIRTIPNQVLTGPATAPPVYSTGRGVPDDGSVPYGGPSGREVRKASRTIR